MKLPLLRTEGAPLNFIEWGTLFARRSFTAICVFLMMTDAYVAEVCENYGVERMQNMENLSAEQRAAGVYAQYPQMFPIDPFTIARDKNIEIRYFDRFEGDVVSVIAKERGLHPVIIALNPVISIYDQRFSVAYNLGHYCRLQDLDKLSDFGFIERGDYSVDIRFNEDNDNNNYAYRFAMELLMPKRLIINWHELKINFNVVRHALNVSGDVLKMRYKSLGLSIDAL